MEIDLELVILLIVALSALMPVGIFVQLSRRDKKARQVFSRFGNCRMVKRKDLFFPANLRNRIELLDRKYPVFINESTGAEKRVINSDRRPVIQISVKFNTNASLFLKSSSRKA